jgi:hypothetical protein
VAIESTERYRPSRMARRADSGPAQLTRARPAGAVVLVKPVDIDRLQMEMDRLRASDAANVTTECNDV